MRRPYLSLAALAAIVLFAPDGRAIAQLNGVGGVGADPFSFYYGYYLPHAAAMAAQPTPLDSINQMTARQQYNSQTDRTALYDPISPYGDEDADPLRPYSGKRGGERLAKVQGFNTEAPSALTRGNGPAMYYNRTARYFPSLRTGRGPNRNLATIRGGRGGGMGGMGGMGMMGGMGLAGPR